MRTLYIYGSSFLDQPKIDNKQYCSKSHNLVSEVKDLFDIYDYCFDPQSMNEIKSSIDEVADNILDRNCRTNKKKILISLSETKKTYSSHLLLGYCISANLYFEDCIYGERFYHFNNFLCNDSIKCMHDKISMFNCDQELEQPTPLKLITSLIANISNVCNYDQSDKSNPSEIVKEWLMTLDSCIKERHYIGLELSEAPLHVDYCNEVDQASQCIRNNIHMILKTKPRFKEQFLYFFHQYERLKLQCASQTKNLTTPAPKSKFRTLI